MSALRPTPRKSAHPASPARRATAAGTAAGERAAPQSNGAALMSDCDFGLAMRLSAIIKKKRQVRAPND